jgi:hypothetical protein
MTTLHNLKLKQAMFNRGLPGAAKAIQMGYLLKNRHLITNANAKAILNDILKKHYTLQNKFQFLMNLEQANNNNYLKHGLNTVDWNLIKTNANYRALYNRVASKMRANQVINETARVRLRAQQGPTCWFHSIINGLLLSPRPRAMLKMLTKDVENLPVNANVCPSKRASRTWFLRYIKHLLQGGGPVHDVFKNIEVIKASGLRRTSLTSRFGGTLNDAVRFYDTFFPGEFTNRNGTSAPMFVMKRYGSGYTGPGSNPEVPHELVRNGVRYELTHSIIMFWIKPFPTGHAIAGYKHRDGMYLAYDSNGRTIDYDWTKAAQVSKLHQHYMSRGYDTGNAVVHAIYMRM